MLHALILKGMEHQLDLLTTSDAARQLGIAANTLRVWERTGRLPAIRTASGVRLFARADVDRIAAERATRSTSGQDVAAV
jgi:excisionase family DNA binding protein